MAVSDLTAGQTVGRLKLLFRTYKAVKRQKKDGTNTKAVYWRCLCACGERATIRAYRLSRAVDRGLNISCGCIASDYSLKSKHKGEYGIWYSMIRRCHDKKHHGYPLYGARGIHVCDGWRDPVTGFAQFLEDMGVRPSSRHSIDRKQAGEGYSKDNCRWATDIEQARNKRNTVMIRHPTTGELVPAAQVAEELNVTYQTLRFRLMKDGLWPTQKQTFQPFESSKKKE